MLYNTYPETHISVKLGITRVGSVNCNDDKARDLSVRSRLVVALHCRTNNAILLQHRLQTKAAQIHQHTIQKSLKNNETDNLMPRTLF
jgi:hypothetical protein